MATVTQLTRIFSYNGTDLPDPNPSLSIREVQDLLSAQYPELANAKPRTETSGGRTTVAFTVATRDKMSVYRRLGGTRMALLMVLHPIRMARMVLQGAFEWLLEEWERARGHVRCAHRPAGRSRRGSARIPDGLPGALILP